MKNKLTPEQLKVKTKEWLNKYGKYILAGLTALSLIGTFVACTAFKSSCAPSGTLTTASGYEGSILKDVTLYFGEGEAPFTIANTPELNTVNGQLGAYTPGGSYYPYCEVDSTYDNDVYEFGIYYIDSPGEPCQRAYITTYQLEYELTELSSNEFDYELFDAIYIDATSTTEIRAVSYLYYSFYDASGELITSDFAFDYYTFEYDSSFGSFTTPISITIPEGAVILSLNQTIELSSDGIIEGLNIQQIGMYAPPDYVYKETLQPVYTRWSIVETVTSAIDSMFELEFLGGLSFGTFFGMLIALPVMFFIMKTFLGG